MKKNKQTRESPKYENYSVFLFVFFRLSCIIYSECRLLTETMLCSGHSDPEWIFLYPKMLMLLHWIGLNTDFTHLESNNSHCNNFDVPGKK